MRASINSPSLSNDTMDYQAECQFALEPSIQGLIEKAESAGWNRQQAALAIVALASEHLTDLLSAGGPALLDQRSLS
ncbi:hypothetical protein [Agrobacterium sp.]|uniref:hypothetical protein n=1 Tax=Agrobacterium sp. TaxID=361 RepID=UPI0025C307ED|nr:hypothetical protein [Agrobacterium sp.]MCD4661463.1 hypothetical protein [Agrobacterium sp.]